LVTADEHPEGVKALGELAVVMVPIGLMVLVEVVQLIARIAPNLLPDRLRGGLQHTEGVMLAWSRRGQPAPTRRIVDAPVRDAGPAPSAPTPEPVRIPCDRPEGARLWSAVQVGQLHEGSWHRCAGCPTEEGLVLSLSAGWVPVGSPEAEEARRRWQAPGRAG
jgi:hypothetical protein